MEQRIIDTSKLVIPDLIQLANFGNDQFFIDYDKEADVLSISYGKPQKADDAIQEKGIIYRKKGNSSFQI